MENLLPVLLSVSGCIGRAYSAWRVTLRGADTVIADLRERLQATEEILAIVTGRLEKMAPPRRPQYTPIQRLLILWHLSRHDLSLAAGAKLFVVSVQTLVNWRRAAGRGEELIKTPEPVNKLPALVRDLTHRLKREWPAWGTRRIAGILARLGMKAGRTSVQRRLQSKPGPKRAGRVAKELLQRLRAKAPGHVYQADFTKLKGFFRSVTVGAVIDAFSRKVLAVKVCVGEPTAAMAMGLVREAVRAHGQAKWIVTDHGTPFTAGAFTRLLRRLGIRRRYGAVGRSNANARLERFWRSMKEEYGRALNRYRPAARLERDLQNYTDWHNRHRPHQGLGNRTPEEVWNQSRPRRKRRIARGRLVVRRLAGDARLPVFSLRRSA